MGNRQARAMTPTLACREVSVSPLDRWPAESLQIHTQEGCSYRGQSEPEAGEAPLLKGCWAGREILQPRWKVPPGEDERGEVNCEKEEATSPG